MKKKALSLFLALVLALALVPSALALDLASADISQPVSITMYSSGWVCTPFPEDDPFKDYIQKTFNIDFNLVIVPDGDMSQKVFTAVAAGNDPDFIYYRNKTLLQQLYDQGVLAADHAPFYEKLPTFAGFTTDLMKAATTVDGKMFAMPRYPEGAAFSCFNLRQDYLDALGLGAPKTAEELMEVFRQFSFNDPNGNGLGDTYGFGAAGNNASISIWSLRYLFGPVGFHIENGAVQNAYTQPQFKEFLDFAKQMYDEGVLDPDFYTMTSETFDANLYNGKYGAYYGEPLVAKWMENATGATGKYIDVWTPIECPKGSETGGSYPDVPPTTGYYAIFDQATADPVKLDRLLLFIDQGQYPNDPYWALRWGVDIYPNAQLTPFSGDAGLFFPQGDDPRAMAGSLWDYGCWNGVAIDKVKYSPGTAPSDLDTIVVAKEQTALAYPRMPALDSLVTYDAGAVENFNLLIEEFAYQYITGQNNDLSGFYARLRSIGWQDYMASAQAQLTEAGLVG